MRTSVKTLVAVLVLSCCTLAADPLLILTDAGYQLLTVGPNGAVLSEAASVNGVLDLRANAPDPIPDPPPPTGDSISEKVSGWAKSVNDPVSAQALAVAYKTVGQSAAGQSREKVLTALRQASDAVLSATGGEEKWKPWRQKVSDLIDSEEAKGPVDWPKFCASVAEGLENSASAQPALDPALLTLIVNLILQIVQLIFGGGGTGV